MRRLALAAAAFIAALLYAAPGFAAVPAEVVSPSGKPLAAAGARSFAYPADGSVVSVASWHSVRSGVVLDGVQLLHGRVQAAHVVVRNDGTGSIDDLVVDGLRRDPAQNSLFGLDSATYLVVLQKAVIHDAGGRHSGFVGLRLTVAPGYPGLPQGAQVLVGLTGPKPRPNSRRQQLAASTSTSTLAAGPWAALGFAATPRLGVGVATVNEPLLGLPSFALAGGGTRGEQAVVIAERYLGIPYRWGGADPQTGFDCSGLTKFVYAQLGVSLIHYAAAQFHEGTPVPPALLEPGDLVFFEPTALGPGHVGIYVGGGEFLHAPHTGDVVKISSLTGRYRTGFVGAVRP
jgi:cell wall-associated NlpC family hydrolase